MSRAHNQQLPYSDFLPSFRLAKGSRPKAAMKSASMLASNTLGS